MVTDERCRGGSNLERAQLILVGAVTIAVLLIGLTIVLNSAVFTENVAEGNSVDVSGDIQEFDREAVGNLKSIVFRVNHNRAYRAGGTGPDELRRHARENVSAYGRVLGESYADTGSVFVNVTIHDPPTIGERFVQREDADFSKNAGVDTWPLLFNGDVELGWFLVNLHVANVSQTEPTYIEFTNASGTEFNVSIRRTNDNKIEVDSFLDGNDISNGEPCQPQNGRVLLDLVDGTSYTSDCEFNGTSALDPPYESIEFVDGDNAHGKYDVVVYGTSNNQVPNACNSPQLDRPCEGAAIWSVNVSTHYRTGSIDSETAHEVEVYD